MSRGIAAAATAALLVCTVFVGVAAGQPGTAPVAGDGGYHFDVGGDDQRIEFWLHLDLLTNLGAPGDFGFSAVGTAMNTTVIVVDVQLQFAGVGDLGGFLTNPFSRFAIVAEWELDLPFLSAGPAADDDFNYRDNESIHGSQGLQA